MIDSQHPRTVGEFRSGQQFFPLCCGTHCCATKCMDPAGGCCGCILRSAFGASASVLKFDYSAVEHGMHDGKRDEFVKDPFWMTSVVYAMICGQTYGPLPGIQGDAHRTLLGKWEFDVSEIKQPVWLFHGDKDADMSCNPNASPKWIKALIPHAKVEMIEDCAHVLAVGPNGDTRDRFIKAVKDMPLSGAPPAPEEMPRGN